MKDKIFYIGVVIFNFIFAITSWNYPFISALYPRLLIICSLILVFIDVISKKRHKNTTQDEDVKTMHTKTTNAPRLLKYLGCGVLFIILLPFAGFSLTTLVTMITLFMLLGVKPKTSIGVALGTTISLYIVFIILLKVPLPMGAIVKLLN